MTILVQPLLRYYIPPNVVVYMLVNSVLYMICCEEYSKIVLVLPDTATLEYNTVHLTVQSVF